MKLLIAFLALLGSVSLPAAEPSVTIESKDSAYLSLAEALAAATDGDTLKISGTHLGNFVIARPLTLSGSDDARIDGGGRGTVLEVKADGVTIENLSISGSGRDRNPKLIRGPAGVCIAADGATLRGLQVSDCEWGVIFFGVEGGRLEDSLIERNHRVGVKVMGGRKHRIIHNRIHRNQLGVLVDSSYGQATEMELPSWSDHAQIMRMAKFMKTATHSEAVVISDNKVRGNGAVGIQVYSYSTGVEVSRNEVSETARETEPDLAFIESRLAMMATALGIGESELEQEAKRHLGSAILVYCGPSKTRVVENRCEKNAGFGIGLRCTEENEVSRNVVRENQSGVFLDRASTDKITGNEVSGHKQFGIVIEADEVLRMGKRSSGNLVAGNTLVENSINAYDAAGKVFSMEEIAKIFEKTPPLGMPKRYFSDPAMRSSLIDGAVKHQSPGTNRWDDGTLGNYYDDFDESSEGFKDADENGIGDDPRPIPGGDAADRFPLATAPD